MTLTPVIYGTTGANTNTWNWTDEYVRQAKEWLRGFTFRPEPTRPAWRFDVTRRDGSTTATSVDYPLYTLGPGVYLLITAETPNSRGEHEHFPLIHTMLIDLAQMRTRDEFLRWVMAGIVRVLTHEVMEYALVDGRRVVDPHPSSYEVLYDLPLPT